MTKTNEALAPPLWLPRSWARASVRITLCVLAGAMGILSWMLLRWAGFGHALSSVMSALLALQIIVLFGVGALSRQYTEDLLRTWERDPILKGWPLAVGLVGGVSLGIGVAYVSTNLLVAGRASITQTMIAFALCVVGGLGCGIFLLCWAKRSGKLSWSFGNRSVAIVIAALAMVTWSGTSLGLDLVVGTHWWYHAHVHAKAHTKVLKRGKQLQNTRLTKLYDRNHRYLGIYAKARSDWNQAYNDPSILGWRLSRLIKLSEGAVQRPTWWWRLMPAGRKLKCAPFSFLSFMRAPYYYLKQGRKVGGSPPSLQAAKNFHDFGATRQGLSLRGTLRAKLFKEMPRAYLMCRSFTPAQMMGIYLTTVWSGTGDHYGVHRMALYFFGKSDPRRLTWSEAAVLIASLPNPGRMNPWYLQSCRESKCINKRQARIYRTWRKRIYQLKQKLRVRGFRVPKGLPNFRNGLQKRVKMLSEDWKYHDSHIRKWLPTWLPKRYFGKLSGDSITLTYDRHLTIGPGDKEGLIEIARKEMNQRRGRLHNLQLSYSLIDAKDGGVVSQYGGTMYLDMSMAQKPVMGSVFKTITLLAAHKWPHALPLPNHSGDGRNHRSFVYHPNKKARYHTVRNSHNMPHYLSKLSALASSANIAFVYLSLRWTWMLSEQAWRRVMLIGLRQKLQYRMNLSPQKAEKKARALLQTPKRLQTLLEKRFGYRHYFKSPLSTSTFEAAKAATVRKLLYEAQRNAVDSKKPSPNLALGAKQINPLIPKEKKVLPKHLAELIAARYPSRVPNVPRLKAVLSQEQRQLWQRFKETPLLQLSWNPEFRMEMGLRYIIYLATQIGGFDIKRSHLRPVLTLTLGVNNANTQELATMAASFAAEKPVTPYLIKRITRQHKTSYQQQGNIRRLPLIPASAFAQVKRAMSLTLQRGTAARAGRMVTKAFNTETLHNAGAKTGTVQNDRGVSCIGFIGKHAGALTLSTPNNKPLKTYLLRKHLEQPLQAAEATLQAIQEKRNQLDEPTDDARQKVVKKYQSTLKQLQKKRAGAQKKLEKAQARITKAEQTADQYEDAVTTITKTGLLIERLDAKDKALAAQQKALEEKLKRKPKTLKKPAKRTKKKLAKRAKKQNKGKSGQQPKPPARTKPGAGKLKARSKVLPKSLADQRSAYKTRRVALLEAHKEAKAIRAKHKAAFHRAYRAKKLRSSDACALLFQLLGHWKQARTTKSANNQ